MTLQGTVDGRKVHEPRRQAQYAVGVPAKVCVEVLAKATPPCDSFGAFPSVGDTREELEGEHA